MKLIVNSMATHLFFAHAWLSYLAVAVWGVIAYGSLLWRLSRREG
jgi:hypothetical protein